MYGAGLGSFIWNNLIPLMKFPVLTIDFPNREKEGNINLSFNDYKDSALGQINNWDVEKFIIVTHSIGGCVGLSLTDHFADRIVGFVGIGSVLPTNGDSFIACLPFPQRLLMPIILTLFGTKPPQKSIQQELCNDLSESQCLEIVNRFTPEATLRHCPHPPGW